MVPVRTPSVELFTRLTRIRFLTEPRGIEPQSLESLLGSLKWDLRDLTERLLDLLIILRIPVRDPVDNSSRPNR
jgi:hypothetical protein